MTLPDLLHLATPLTIAALIAWACDHHRKGQQP
jgi:hypothetical protein